MKDINNNILEILVCPKDHGRLKMEQNYLRCLNGGANFEKLCGSFRVNSRDFMK
jgi:hypothetical protein